MTNKKTDLSGTSMGYKVFAVVILVLITLFFLFPLCFQLFLPQLFLFLLRDPVIRHESDSPCQQNCHQHRDNDDQRRL